MAREYSEPDNVTFAFGIVADCQYKPAADGNVEGRTQRYSEVPEKAKEAVRVWRGMSPGLAGVLNLGDTIDGREGLAESLQDLEEMTAVFDALGPQLPILHVIGNHDLRVTRQECLTRLRLPAPYYSHPLGPGWRLLVLDTTQLTSGAGWEQGSPEAREAAEYLAAHPLGPGRTHMVAWNGGLGSKQRSWLAEELAAADAAGDRVIVASHHPLGWGSARDTHMAWDWEEVQALLLAARSPALCLSGHDHMGGYARVGGLHFVTLEAMLEAPTGSNAFGVVYVTPHQLLLHGHGAMTSRTLQL